MPSKPKSEIRHIVELKGLMKKWRRSLCLSRSYSGSVRAGHLAVYVGSDRTRFVIPTRFLNYPVFTSLLEEAEAEFGFQVDGGLTFTCEIEFFDWVVGSLQRDEGRFKGLGLDRFLILFSDATASASSNVNPNCKLSRDCYSPLIQKSRA